MHNDIKTSVCENFNFPFNNKNILECWTCGTITSQHSPLKLQKKNAKFPKFFQNKWEEDKSVDFTCFCLFRRACPIHVIYMVQLMKIGQKKIWDIKQDLSFECSKPNRSFCLASNISVSYVFTVYLFLSLSKSLSCMFIHMVHLMKIGP